MNESRFKSEALRVNLDRTRVEQVELPSEQQWLQDCCRDRFGIHKRLESFLLEYHHPYSNLSVLIRDFRKIVLEDFWFFESIEEAPRAFYTLADLFGGLMTRLNEDLLLERTLQTLIEFLEKLSATRCASACEPAMSRCLDVVEGVLSGNQPLFARSSSYLKTHGKSLAGWAAFSARVTGLLKKALEHNHRFWSETGQLENWLHENAKLFSADHSERARTLGSPFFAELADRIARAESFDDLLPVIDYFELANRFRGLMDDVGNPFDRAHYILYLVRLPGMSHLIDQLLWDLNRAFRNIRDRLQLPAAKPEEHAPLMVDVDESASSVVRPQKRDELLAFIEQVFNRFEELKADHLGTVMDCIQTLGKEVYDVGDRQIVDRYIDRLIAFGFVPPRVRGVGDDWQVDVDPNHIKCIRVWLQLFECNPDWSTKLLSALIVNLKIGGVFISDTDLFQKDITRLLNSDISNCYELIRQLGRLFPVYFNEIGAEGELREVTTRIDEMCHRQDGLIHFLRKQVHTESNNTHIDLVDRIARYWFDDDANALEPFVPADVFSQLSERNGCLESMQQAMRALCDRFNCSPEEMLNLESGRLRSAMDDLNDLDTVSRDRLVLLGRLKMLLQQKYNLDAAGVIPSMRRLPMFVENDIQQLEDLLQQDNPEATLKYVFGMMERLRSVILDPQPSQGYEDIYYKRHVAAGIPSMYGHYTEPKFEALGLTFRLASLATILLEGLISKTNLTYICGRTLRWIAGVLELFRDGLKLVGISNESFDSHLRMLRFGLTTSSFSIGQFVNLFQFMSNNIKQIIKDYFVSYHEETLQVVVEQHLRRMQPDLICRQEWVRELHRYSELFYRDILSNAFLVQPLDNFISKIMDTLNSMVDRLAPDIIPSVMEFDQDLLISPLDFATPEIDNHVFLGAKGYFLKRLHDYGFPIPAGFILTTEMFRRRRAITTYAELNSEVEHLIEQAIRRLESKMGQRLGDTENPLLLSVRSGAAISMPGAMNTFLNVGMNGQVVETLARKPGYAWAAWDCYRRLLQTWGMVNRISRDDFDGVIDSFKQRYGVKEKVRFTPDQMRQITDAYLQLLLDNHVQMEADPYRQVVQAVHAVLDSWYTERAKVYRRQLRIADEWGTAVIVQAMVFGNIGDDSGTGVVFTRDPLARTSGLSLYGDFTLRSQGEDVVSGLVHTLPISERQRQRGGYSGDMSLEKDFPGIYQAMLEKAQSLTRELGFGHQEIEFTFESADPNDLFLLQTRDYVVRKEDSVTVFTDEHMESRVLGRGIGVGGGAMNGVVAFDMDDLVRFAKTQPDCKRILVRPDTVPDDIGMVFECDGLLTARGGATSHAAVTASRLGKTCIVNCRVLRVNEKDKVCTINEHEFRPGDPIAIDGRVGNIYAGNHPIGMASIEVP